MDGTNPPRRLLCLLRVLRLRLPPILGRTPIPSDTKKLRPASADTGAFPVKYDRGNGPAPPLLRVLRRFVCRTILLFKENKLDQSCNVTIYPVIIFNNLRKYTNMY